MSHPELDAFIERNATRGVLVDTNVLLLHFVGGLDPALITEFKRTRIFVEEDYETLERLLNFFAVVYTTPNVMTEVSNYGGALGEPRRSEFFNLIGRTVSGMRERYVSTGALAERAEFIRLAVADTSIVAVAEPRCGVVTDDRRLAAELQAIGVDVINFNHVRTLAWK